ncbi:methylmalonyl-CoA mutase family protein [Leptospira interrogans]|uniref:methylmalonyl-CoA mutase family protein n=1 Tax=Leptospira interrogans TaxID=173 RepID=UPI0034D4E99D
MEISYTLPHVLDYVRTVTKAANVIDMFATRLPFFCALSLSHLLYIVKFCAGRFFLAHPLI